MIYYHTSPEIIKKPEKFGGRFGDFIFFASNPYFMTAAKNPVVYSIDISEMNIVDECEIDVDLSVFDMSDYEQRWDAQLAIAEQAESDGFDGVFVQDEQGRSIMLNIKKVLDKMIIND